MKHFMHFEIIIKLNFTYFRISRDAKISCKFFTNLRKEESIIFSSIFPAEDVICFQENTGHVILSYTKIIALTGKVILSR
jgi:hypothetical protein